MGTKHHNDGAQILLYAALFCYSVSSVFSKFAAQEELLSLGFLLLYGCSLLVLVMYALLWQKVLKRVPLSTAYANKPLETLFSMAWGILLFGETLSGWMILGTVILLVGIRIVVTADE